ncbi:MAG: sensor histidine kinase [Cumulibacter sp.]
MLAVSAWGAALVGTAASGGVSAGDIAGITVVVGLPVLAGGYLGVRRDLLASLRAQVRQAQAERDLRDRQAQISERNRIAGEMHDILAHKVSLIALHAGSLEVNPRVGPVEIERTAALIGSTARQALGDLRDVLGVLRTDRSADGDDLAPQPGLADIERLVSASQAAGVPLTLECDTTPVSDVIGRTAYRVVQEALTNVHKHAAGRTRRSASKSSRTKRLRFRFGMGCHQ